MKNKRAIFLLVVILILSVSMFTGCQKTGTVILETNGGELPFFTKYEDISTIEKEPIPIKEGYDFEGWYSDKYFDSERLEFPLKIEKDMTIYAKWKMNEEYTVVDLFKKRAAGIEPYNYNINGSYYTSRTTRESNIYTYEFANTTSKVFERTRFIYDSRDNTFSIFTALFVKEGSAMMGFLTEIKFSWGNFSKGAGEGQVVYYSNGSILHSNYFDIKVTSYYNSNLTVMIAENANNLYISSASQEKSALKENIEIGILRANKFLEDANITIH